MTEVYGLWILYGSAIPCTVTPIDNGQLSLREVITQEWIHAEKCTLLVNTCRGLRQVFTPRRIHFTQVLLASLKVLCTYPDLTPGPEQWSITPIDNGLRLVAGVLRANVNHVNCVQCSCLLWQRSMDFKSCMALAFLLLLVFLSFVTEVYGL